MSIKNVTDFQKNLIGWIGIGIALIGGLIALNNKVNANTIKVEQVQAQAQEMAKQDRNVSDQINSLRLEMLQGFNEIKLQLKDKQDREQN